MDRQAYKKFLPKYLKIETNLTTSFMKNLHIIIFLLLVVQTIHAQKKISDSDVSELKAKIENEIVDLRKQQDTADYFSINDKQLCIEFNIDTYRIDTLMVRMINVDFSNQGMVQATSYATVAYDKLLNKYYKKLLTKLNLADQETLRMAQRNWIQYRDSEVKLIDTLSNFEYAGVGLDQRLFAAADILEITKSRVLAIYEHLMGIQK